MDRMQKLPNITHPCIDWVESCDFSKWNLIEIGCGDSTEYFSDRFKSIYGFESNKDWLLKVKYKLQNKVNLKLFDPYNIQSIHIDSMQDSLVIIDAGCNRFQISKHLLPKNYDLYILDNSEFYPNTEKLFLDNGFNSIPFYGKKFSSNFTCCTTLFFKSTSRFPPKNLNYKNIDCRPYTGNNLWDSPF